MLHQGWGLIGWVLLEAGDLKLDFCAAVDKSDRRNFVDEYISVAVAVWQERSLEMFARGYRANWSSILVASSVKSSLISSVGALKISMFYYQFMLSKLFCRNEREDKKRFTN